MKLIPSGSEIPERISMKLGIYNGVMGVTTQSHPCGAATTSVICVNTCLVTSWFLNRPFFDRVDLIKPVSNVRTSVRQQIASSISMKFGL